MTHRSFLLAAVLRLLAPAAPAQVFTPAPVSGEAANPFVHPGVFSSQNELETIRRRVASHDPADPMTAGWQSVMSSRFNDLDYRPESVSIVTRVGRSPTPVHERDSAMVAYVMALRWVLTGDEAARAKALAVMNAWAAVFQDHQGDENTYLDSAWVVTVWSAAGEIMRHGKYMGRPANWLPGDIDKFSAMIRALEAQSSRIITRPFNPGSNWGMSAMLGDMAAGVFLDDHAMYDQGRDAVLKYMPAIIKKEGWCNGIFRDSWHGGVALTAAIRATCPSMMPSTTGKATRASSSRFAGTRVPCAGFPPGRCQRCRAGRCTRTRAGFYTRIEHVPGLADFRDMVPRFYRPSGQDNAIYITSDSLTHADLN